MSNASTERTHNMADIDIADLAAVREARQQASDVGHWRRILAIYGDHLPACDVRVITPASAVVCNCGWAEAFGS